MAASLEPGNIKIYIFKYSAHIFARADLPMESCC